MPWDRISSGTKAALAVFLFAGIIWALTSVSPKQDRSAEALIGQRIFKLEIADTPSLMARGLAGRTRIPKNKGMLFLFSKPGQHSFWMKDMLIPVDILWMRNDAIVFIRENIKPPRAGMADEELERFAPPEESDAVIEVAAGTVKELGLRTGQSVRILLP